MKKLILVSILFINGFSNNLEKLYKEAQFFEKNQDYKKAMERYKQISNIKLQKQTNTKKENAYALYREKIYKNSKLEDKETNKTIKQIITKNFDLHPYKKNYLLPITYDLRKRDDRKQFETSYQLSFEKPIFYNLFGLNEVISGAYTQKSFWQTFEDSAPFRETNYEPELFIEIPYNKSNYLKGLKLAFNHQSNGREEPFSRSWNRLYLSGYFKFSKLFIIPKIWYRIPEKSKDNDNPDLQKYVGYGNLKIIYPYKKHLFEFTLRDNLRFNSQNKGSLALDWTFPLPEFFGQKNSFGMIQLFSGYGNNLIDYNKETHKIGFGIAFSR